MTLSMMKRHMAHSQGMTMFMAMVLLLGMLVSTGAVADIAGRLLFARGDVQLLHADEVPRKANRGDSVEVGDSVQTGANSNAQIRMSDGAMIALRAHTLFKVDQQTYHKDAPGEGSQTAELLRGGMRAITGAIGHANPSAVSYKTPVATIGIRGTVIDVIYVPPEGLPGLPGVKPGHYTLVLKGRVEVSNPAGSLTLAAGEIAYAADENTPPVLRPDLTWVFVQYASLTKGAGGEEASDDSTGGGDGDSGNGGDDGTGGGSGDTTPDTGSIDNVLTETAVPHGVVKPGPYALAITADISIYQGTFADSAVTLGGSGELVYATGGTGGDIYTFDAFGSAINTGSTTIGDSTVNWGEYDYMGVNLYDSSSNPLTTTLNVQYIDATQVMTGLNDLPTTGSFTYNYVGGAGAILDNTSSLVVDFGNATMSVNLDSTPYAESWTASNQSISNFYGSGISLTSVGYGPGSGGISGRFVGSNADGAITSFWIFPDGNVAGVAAFSR